MPLLKGEKTGKKGRSRVPVSRSPAFGREGKSSIKGQGNSKKKKKKSTRKTRRALYPRA